MQQKTISVTPILVCACWVASFFAGATCFADHDLAREQLPTSWKDDAELTDVFFLNPNLGWAVGAQGVILRTTNGGNTWKEISNASKELINELPLDQKIRNLKRGIQSGSTGLANGRSTHHPVRCRFESVHFVDEKYGWIGGGYEVPYVGRTRAVVMRTKDGGLSWDAVDGLVIPRINRLHFSDPINGWAVGKTGNLFQTGVFSTSDGGQTWSSQTADKTDGWVDGHQTQSGYITIDYSGRAGVMGPNGYEASVVLGGSEAPLTKLAMADHSTGWAVGQQGTVLMTKNGGLSWSPMKGIQNTDQTRLFDFKTLSVTDQKVWVAGNPGTYLFSIDRQTGHTTAHRTPLTTTINQVVFVDANHGWAVGALGAIIATRDGGQTWHHQRGDHRRVALLGVAPGVESLPLEVFSKYATEENRICASVILNGTAEQLQSAVQASDRIGCVATVAIDRSQVTERERQSMLEKTVRAIRIWQPSVLVCNSGHVLATVGGIEPLDPVSLLERAIRMAADSSAFPEQIEKAGLKTWRVERLAYRDPAGTVGIDPQRLLPRSGVLIEDQISISRVLIGQSILQDLGPNYRVNHLSNVNRMNAGDLLSGLGPASKTPTRRNADTKRGNLVMIQQATAKQKKFKQFIQFEANTPHDLQIWRQQIESFAMTMDNDVAGVWLMHLAERYLEKGKTELASQAIHSIVIRWPDHAFAPAALTWLSQYYASDEFGQIEFAKRVRAGLFDQTGNVSKAERIKNQFQTTPQTIQQGGGSHLVWVPTQPVKAAGQSTSDPKVAQVNHETEIAKYRPKFFDERLKLAGYYLSQLGQRDPELVAGASYQFLESQISRRLNGSIMSEGRLRNLAQIRSPQDNGSAVGARRELGLHDLLHDSTGPVEVHTCHATESRPHLDGQLNETFWQVAMNNGNAIRANVQLPMLQPGTQSDIAIFAYDKEFLYAGFRCQKIKGHFYNVRKSARPRDANLERRDRIEWAIDLDRDYRSANRFVIDHRGWVHESCGGSKGWNPDWYISQSEDETTWTVELAIPLEQITPGGIEPGSTWAFQIARRAFEINNIWEEQSPRGQNSNPTSTLSPHRLGLQAGFESDASRFQLIRFEPTQNTPTQGTPTQSTPLESDRPKISNETQLETGQNPIQPVSANYSK